MLTTFLFPLGKRVLKIVPTLPTVQCFVFNTTVLRKQGIKSLDIVYSCAEYHSSAALQEILWDCKYSRNRLAGYALGKWMSSILHRIPNNALYTLVPTPLHWTRLLWRTFNQSHVIAVGIQELHKLNLMPCLRRQRYTGTQVRRRRSERIAAMHNAFIAKDKVPKYILLIDDIWTTGATLDACAKALKSAGAAYVIALTAAYAKPSKI